MHKYKDILQTYEYILAIFNAYLHTYFAIFSACFPSSLITKTSQRKHQNYLNNQALYFLLNLHELHFPRIILHQIIIIYKCIPTLPHANWPYQLFATSMQNTKRSQELSHTLFLLSLGIRPLYTNCVLFVVIVPTVFAVSGINKI